MIPVIDPRHFMEECRRELKVGSSTPRSWEMASDVLTGFAARQNGGFLTGTSEIEAQLLEGTIGQAATIELVAFLRLFRQLPSIPEILMNPDTAPVPEERRRGSPSPRRSAACSTASTRPRSVLRH